MRHFIIVQQSLFIDMSDVEPFLGKVKSLLDLLEESGVARYFPDPEAPNLGGRPDYDPCSMFAAVALAFSTKASSLRDIESLCRFDVRFRALLGGRVPSIRLIREVHQGGRVPERGRDLRARRQGDGGRFSLPLADLFVDGTKIEANANKYKFVWSAEALFVDLGWQGMSVAKRTPFQQKDIQKNDLQFASVILCKPALIEFGIFEKLFSSKSRSYQPFR